MFDDVQENLSKLREKIENEDRIKSPVRLSKGDIVEMELDENDGITLDGQYETRRKYIVIIGVTSKGDIYGAYLINSKINFIKNNDIMKNYQYIPQFRSIILCDLLLYIDVTFWYLSIDLGFFWGSWFCMGIKSPTQTQWGI